MTLNKTAVTIGALAIVAAVFACGVKEPDPANGGAASSEGGARDGRGDAPPPVGVTVAPDGNGVCCPLESPCGPGYHGGWAATADECIYVVSYDGSFDRKTDEHGCVEWESRGIQSGGDLCCGCVAPVDASPDVSDASSD